MAEFRMPSTTEFDTITRHTQREIRHNLLATAARYDRRHGLVMITLSNGTAVGFPLAALPGLEDATPDELRTIHVEAGGYGIHVPARDADIAIPRLLEDYLGSTLMKRAQSRASASRANGRMGGRPRKTAA